MLVGLNSVRDAKSNLDDELMQAEVDRTASDYITENYDELCRFCRQLGVSPDKVPDLVHDMYINIVKMENNGEGFQETFVKSNGEEVSFEVSTFIHKRMKLYSRSYKYHSDSSEIAMISMPEWHTVEEPFFSSDGKYLGSKKTKVKKKVTRVINVKSTCAGEDTDDGDKQITDAYQYAYTMASVDSEVGDVEAFESLREEIDFCIDICSKYDVDILSLFKKRESIADMLGNVARNRTAALGIFKRIRRVADENDEFKQAYSDIMEYGAKNRAALDYVLAAF